MPRPFTSLVILAVTLLSAAVQAAPPALVRTIDEGTPASDWTVAGEEVVHTAGTLGGSLYDPWSMDRPGSITLLGDLPADSGEFRCNVRTSPSLANGNVGLVFGFKDPDNYYRLRAAAGKDFCEVVRKSEGRTTLIYRGIQRLRRDRWRPLAFRFDGGKAILEIEHHTIGIEPYQPAGYGVGLYVWGNDNARFSGIQIGPLTGTAPRLVIVDPFPGQISNQDQLDIRAMVFGRFTGEPRVLFELDPRGDQPQSVLKGAPLAVSFGRVSPGEHSLQAHLLIDDATLEQVVISPVGIGEEWVALGDGLTWGTGDDVPADDVSRDERSNFGGYTPILGDLAARELGKPVFVAVEGVPGHGAKEGADRLDGILARHPRATRYLVLYGTSDLNNTRRLPSGLNLPDATGTYRHYMRSIVARIREKGAAAVLAKVPFIDAARVADGVYSASDPLLLEYNQVNDELVREHGLPPAPDLYNHFRTHPAQLSDGVHPNGKGYQAMAQKWLDAIKQ